MDAAKTFYSTAFGWPLVDYGPDYAGIQGPTKEVGGLRRDSDVRAGGPLVIVYSEDLERSVEAVTAAGGTIVTPIHAFPGGRRFHFGDPAGNELAVWSDRNNMTPETQAPRSGARGQLKSEYARWVPQCRQRNRYAVASPSLSSAPM
jgi:uncharacterized protein